MKCPKCNIELIEMDTNYDGNTNLSDVLYFCPKCKKRYHGVYCHNCDNEYLQDRGE